MRHALLSISLVLLFGTLTARAADLVDTQHPFLLWMKKDLPDLRAKAASDESTKRQIERLLVIDARNPKAGGNVNALNLFKYAILQDQAAGDTEKKQLLKFIDWKMPENIPGDPNSRNAGYREDRTLDALRYDVLYDQLTPQEREGIEASARLLIDHCLANPGPWKVGDPGLENGSRCGWLPNMQWPTMAGAHVWAVTLKDQKRIDAIFNASGGWKWYFDFYIADGRFYMEEFAKFYSNIGSMILWCNGLDRLGMSQYGWGYTGKGGATMRRFVGSLIDASLPQVPRPDAPGAWDIPVIWMGDAGREWLAAGRLGDWSQNRMNGAISKMRQPLWWEACAQKFPNQGFEFLLGKMAAPGESTYLPTMYFGLGPIDPKQTKAPPAPSSVNFERGFAILRAEEGPAYWESPKPAVALQFGMYYVHYVHDCFSILDFVANNRLIYDKIGRIGTNYAGGDAWRDHGRGQASAVVVDGQQVKPVDNGETGCKNQRIRQSLKGPAKFVAVRANGLVPGVDQERALLLCTDYLFDASWLNSDSSHTYDWHVMTTGSLTATHQADWQTLSGPESMLGGRSLKEPVIHLTDVRARSTGADTWSESLILPPDANQKEAAGSIGVRVTMLGEDGSILLTGKPPQPAPAKEKTTPDIGGTKLIVTRQVAKTCFAAVHEPLSNGESSSRIAEVRRLAELPGGIAVAVVGKADSGINDRIIILAGDQVGKPALISSGEENFTTSDSLWIRFGGERIDAWGDTAQLTIKVGGSPQLFINGEKVNATIQNGLLTWKK